MTIGGIYGLLTFVVLAINWLAARQQQNRGAVVLSLAFCAAWAITGGLREKFPLPWAWLAAGPIDLGLLIAALYIGKQAKAAWAGAICIPLLVGLVLQVDLWAAWYPHRHENYDQSLHDIYYRYWEGTEVLATLELAYLVWPGGRILGAIFSRWIDRFHSVPDRRRRAL